MPPFVGVAVNVAGSPEQTVEGPVMLTAGVSEEFTVIVIALEEAVAGDAQGSLEVNTTVITSPLASDVLV